MNVVDYIKHKHHVPQHRANKIIQAKQVCVMFGLEPEFNIAMNNPALKNNPYHNTYHTACMVVNAYDACHWYIKRKQTPKHMKELIAACVFHDIHHTAGKFNDTINVALAINEAVESLKDRWDASFVNETASIISVTEYPFCKEPITLEQKIIRDCDLMQILEPDWMDMIFEGLLTELKRSPKFKDLTVETFVPLQIQFLKNAVFYTDWFKEAKSKDWNNALLILEEFK